MRNIPKSIFSDYMEDVQGKEKQEKEKSPFYGKDVHDVRKAKLDKQSTEVKKEWSPEGYKLKRFKVVETIMFDDEPLLAREVTLDFSDRTSSQISIDK